MILDALTRVSDAQDFTGAGDEVSESSIDLGNVTPKRDVGAGEALAVFIVVTTLAADGGGGTFQFAFIQSANADLSSGDQLVLSQSVAKAALPAGTIVQIDIPPGVITKRYIGAQGILGGTTPTVSASIFIAPRSFAQQFKSYARGYVIE